MNPMIIGDKMGGAGQDRLGPDRERHNFMAFLAAGGRENLALRYDTFLIFDELIRDRAYDFEARLPRGATVINFGANVGILPLFILFKRHPRKIIACEPDPHNLELLLHNTRPWRDIIDVVGAAVTGDETPRVLHFRSDPVNTGAGTLTANGVPVLGIPVNEMLQLARNTAGGEPLYVFCDCEGGEWSVFADGTDLDDVAVIWGEAHVPDEPHPEWGPGPHSKAELLRLLARRGWTADLHDLPRDEMVASRGERFLFTAINRRPHLPRPPRELVLTGAAVPRTASLGSGAVEMPSDALTARVQRGFAAVAGAMAITPDQARDACGPELGPLLNTFLGEDGDRSLDRESRRSIAMRLAALVRAEADNIRAATGDGWLSQGSVLVDDPWWVEPDVMAFFAIPDTMWPALAHRSKDLYVALNERIRAMELMQQTGVSSVLRTYAPAGATAGAAPTSDALDDIAAERWPRGLSVGDAIRWSMAATGIIRRRFAEIASALAMTHTEMVEAVDVAHRPHIDAFLNPGRTPALDGPAARSMAVKLFGLSRAVQREFAAVLRAANVTDGAPLFENPWALETGTLIDLGVLAACSFDERLTRAITTLRAFGCPSGDDPKLYATRAIFSDSPLEQDDCQAAIEDLAYYTYTRLPVPGYAREHYAHALRTMRLDGMRAIDVMLRYLVRAKPSESSTGDIPNLFHARTELVNTA